MQQIISTLINKPLFEAGVGFIVFVLIIIFSSFSLNFNFYDVIRLIEKAFHIASWKSLIYPLIIFCIAKGSYIVLSMVDGTKLKVIMTNDGTIYEFVNTVVIVLITYFVFLGIYLFKQAKIQQMDEYSSWDKYTTEISSAEDCTALNINNISLFFDPLGIKYLLPQIRLKCKKMDGFKLIRIISIPGKRKKDKRYINLISKALSIHNNLSEEEKILYNIVELHRIPNIELHLVPQGIITDRIKEISKKNKNIIKKTLFHFHDQNVTNDNWFKKKLFRLSVFFTYKKRSLQIFDSFLIDGKGFHPTQKKETFIICDHIDEFKDLFKTFVDAIIDDNEYELNELMKYIKKMID